MTTLSLIMGKIFITHWKNNKKQVPRSNNEKLEIYHLHYHIISLALQGFLGLLVLY